MASILRQILKGRGNMIDCWTGQQTLSSLISSQASKIQSVNYDSILKSFSNPIHALIVDPRAEGRLKSIADERIAELSNCAIPAKAPSEYTWFEACESSRVSYGMLLVQRAGSLQLFHLARVDDGITALGASTLSMSDQCIVSGFVDSDNLLIKESGEPTEAIRRFLRAAQLFECLECLDALHNGRAVLRPPESIKHKGKRQAEEHQPNSLRWWTIQGVDQSTAIHEAATLERSAVGGDAEVA